MGMGLGGSLLLAVSGVGVGGNVAAVDTDAGGGRLLMHVPTDTEYEYQLAIGDVITGDVTPIGKPALDRLADLNDPFDAVTFEGSVLVSGLAADPVVVGPDGSVSDFVLAGGIRGMPWSLGDGEHYRVAGGIYAVSTGEFRPLESFSADFGDRDIYVERLAGDWLEITNENATVYVRLSDLDTVRTLPDSASRSFIHLRADGQAVWEEDREGASALMIADLAAPGPMEVAAGEFYSASPFVNLRARVGDLFVAGRTDILLIDPETGETVRNLSAELDLPPRSNVYSMGEGSLLEIAASDREPELWNVETGELVPLGRGSVVHRGDGWVLWEAGGGAMIRVIDLASGIVGDIDLGDLGELPAYFRSPVAVGDHVVVPGCFASRAVVIDPVTATATPASPICSVVATDDGRFVAGGTSLPDERLGFCSTLMVVEELGVGVVQTFPSGCPLAWLVQP